MDLANDELAARARAMVHRILMAAALLCVLGLLMVYSASAVRAGRHDADMSLLFAQSRGLALGVVCFALAAWTPLRWHRRLAPFMAAGCAALLIGVLAFGVRVNGAARWFRWGGVNIQPSEIAKPLLILTLAVLLADAPGGKPRLWGRAGLALLFAGATAGLVAAEPDLGSAALLSVVAFGLLFAGGAPRILAVGLAGLAAAACVFAYEHFEHVRRRVEDWRGGAGFHTNASMTAIGSGGWWGMGLGRGTAKLDYLPEAHTDFIFAMIGQELGLAGTLATLGLFAFILCQGLWLAWTIPERLPALAAFGVSLMIGLQALFNMAVVTGVLPPKGIQLPFVSYGGSGLAMNLAMAGLLVAASRPESWRASAAARPPGAAAEPFARLGARKFPAGADRSREAA